MSDSGNFGYADGLEVSAPARLHFGLFSIGGLTRRQFGGAGMMIQSPRTVVRLRPHVCLAVDGLESELVHRVAERWHAFQKNVGMFGSADNVDQLPVRIEVCQVAMRHAGFGSGTQLACSIALGLCEMFKTPAPSVKELAAMTGRGKRSAIGSHGFFRGGFLVDRGKSATQALSPLDLRIDFPSSWRIVTVIQANEKSVSGQLEKEAFRDLPPTTPQARQQIVSLVKQEMVPALIASDFESFSESLYEFGRMSGMMYAPIQQGPYNGKAITDLVEEISASGVVGVGQSSWGPCVYAVCESQTRAEQLKQGVEDWLAQREVQSTTEISRADNRGVSIKPISQE